MTIAELMEMFEDLLNEIRNLNENLVALRESRSQYPETH